MILSKSGNQKIAICFSGQLRTWKNCIHTFNKLIPKNADIFCHFWDYNTKPNWINDEKIPEKITDEELNEVIDILRPKKYLIENYRIIPTIRSEQLITYFPFLSQYYGIMRSARLKREYEIENDLEYDLVARARYDNYYISTISDSFQFLRPNTMHGFHFGWNYIENTGRMGDMCWFADSQTYDIIADFYLNIWTIDPNRIKFNKDQHQEILFFHYIKKCNINIQNNHWDIKLFRASEDESFSKNKNSYETW